MQCEKRNLEIAALKIAVDRLEGELARQRRTSEQDSANFSVQLADAAAENRSLRLQLSRSASITTTAALNSQCSMPNLDTSCGSCKRLQKLVDILQKKSTSKDSIAEVETQTEFLPEASSSPKDDNEDKSLFDLLESGGRINDLTTQYLEETLGERLETSSQKFNLQSSPQRMPLITQHSTKSSAVEEDGETRGGTADVSRLLERLKNLEAEVESSADQLRASNDEFLQLRERLTNATIEKAHLKAQLDASNDRVSFIFILFLV